MQSPQKGMNRPSAERVGLFQYGTFMSSRGRYSASRVTSKKYFSSIPLGRRVTQSTSDISEGGCNSERGVRVAVVWWNPAPEYCSVF